MAGYGFYNYGNATANTPASAVGDTLVGAFNKANRNNTNMRFPNQWGSSALLGAEGKPYQSKWAFNDPSQQGVVAPTAMPVVGNVNPNTMSMFLQGQSQEAMRGGVSNFADFNSSITNNVPDFFKGDLGIPYSPERMENYPLNGFPYVGGLDNPAAMPAVTSNTGSRPSVFSNNQQTGTVATPTPVQKKFSLSPAVQQQVQQPQQQPVQVRAATADVQPTTSQQISPIGLQSVTGAMNAQPTLGNTIPQSANTEGWFGTAKSWLGDKFGVDATQYLTNPDGTIMMSKEGVPIVNADATSWGDVGAGLMGTAQIGLGAYNMFTGLDQQQQALDTKRGELDLLREKYAEDKRKNQAIVAQNRGA